MRRLRHQRGQTIAEYVLIIAIVVVAAIGILGVFSDTLRSKIGGIILAIGGDKAAVDTQTSKPAQQIFTETNAHGTGG